MEKRVIEGRVGVVVSNTCGRRWAMCDGEFNPVRAFCPDLVDALHRKASHAEIGEVIKDNFPEYDGYGVDPFGLTLVWVPCGTQFRMVEYDGQEGIVYKDRERSRYTTA